MADDVNIKISATDNATAVLQKIRNEMSSVGTSVKALEGKLGTAFNASAFGIGAASLTRFASESLKMFADSERSAAMFLRTLKSTGNTVGTTIGELRAYAQERMQRTIFDDDSIIEAAGHLARFRDIAGETFYEAMDAAQDLSTVMGTDLVSAAQALGRALTDPVEGMSKLARAGIVFTDQQRNQVKLLELLGDKAGQQKIILNELQRGLGGAAVTDAQTPGGIIAQFKNELGEAMEDIGRSVFPTFKASLDLARANLGSVPGAAGGVDALLNGPRGAIGSAADEKKKLEALRASQQAMRDEVNAIRDRIDNQSDVAFWLSGIQNWRDVATLNRNEVRQADIKDEIAIQAGRWGIASQKEMLAALRQSLSNVGTNTAANLLPPWQNLFKDQTFLGGNIGSIAGMIGRDLNSSGVEALFGGLAGLVGSARPMDAAASSDTMRTLQATESRFLTRGRGQLSSDTKAVVKELRATSDILKRIERDLNELPKNTLVVEGIK